MPASLTFKFRPPGKIAAFAQLARPCAPYLSSRRYVRLGPYSGHIVYSEKDANDTGTIVLDVRRSLLRRLFDSIRSLGGIPFEGRRALTTSELGVCRRIEMLYLAAHQAACTAFQSGAQRPDTGRSAVDTAADDAIAALHRAFDCARDPQRLRMAALDMAAEGPQHWADALQILAEPAVDGLFWSNPMAVRKMLSHCADAAALLSLLGNHAATRRRRLQSMSADEKSLARVRTLLCEGIESQPNMNAAYLFLRQFMIPHVSPKAAGQVLIAPLDRPQHAAIIFATLFNKMERYRDATSVTWPVSGLLPELYRRHLSIALRTNQPLRERLLASAREDAHVVSLFATVPASRAKQYAGTVPLYQIEADKCAATKRFARDMFSFMTGGKYGDPNLPDVGVLAAEHVCQAARDLVWGDEEIAGWLTPVAFRYRGESLGVIDPLMKCHPDAGVVKLLRNPRALHVRPQHQEMPPRPDAGRNANQPAGKARQPSMSAQMLRAQAKA